MGNSKSTETATQDNMEKAQKLIDENDVMVFSKSYCPYCKATKQLLNEKNIKYKAIEMDKIKKGPEIHAAVKSLNGNQTSVPSIFIKGKHIGGNDKLQALAKSGELETLINA